MYGGLSDEHYLANCARDAGAMADALARNPLDTPVPSCPGWDLGDLGSHLGVVHRWALASLSSDTPPGEEQPPARDELPGWYADGASALLTALRSTDSAAPCWGFGPHPRTVRFWLRRQAHETAMHRWDAGAALGLPPVLAAELAADGVDEVATMFYPRQVRLGRRQPLGVAVAFTAVETGGTVVIGEGEPVATLHGPVELLLLGLWGRRDLLASLEDGTVRLDGDAAAARAVLSQQLTP
jgi:uncharacterized protein (TIGR03083 family)